MLLLLDMNIGDKVISFYKRVRLNPDPDVFTALVVVCIISLLLGFYNNYQIRNGSFASANLTAEGKKVLPLKNLIKNISSDAERVGNKNAKVVVVAFEDFQCPYCKKFHDETYDKLKKEFIDTGKILFVHYDMAFLGPESTSAGEASLCAAEQGKFWEYRDVLYKNQVSEHNVGNFNDENLLKFAKSIGLDGSKFSECVSADKYVDQINGARSFAESYGIGSTPTFVVNGEMIRGARQYAEFSTVINNALK